MTAVLAVVLLPLSGGVQGWAALACALFFLACAGVSLVSACTDIARGTVRARKEVRDDAG